MEKLKICATGFVGSDVGSVASANAVLLRGLVQRECVVSFFTKPSFVDPRPCLDGIPESVRLSVVDCTNRWGDGFRRRMAPGGGGWWGRAWGSLDSATYNRGLARAMRSEPAADVDLWLGDWARGRGRRPVVSFAQGPPGTDARSVFSRRETIERLAGKPTWMKLAAASRWRLGFGLPSFKDSDHVIVGSSWSKRLLVEDYGVDASRVHAMPYPIDLSAFTPALERRPAAGRLRLFWLGRFVPRKRLDLFLDGLAIAIQSGCDVEAWVVGASGFVPGYERLLNEFPFQNRLTHWPQVPRPQVNAMLAEIDAMAQPSDEENFGSSVAEALACGVPSIVGATNGTADYVCANSIWLTDDRPEGFAAAVLEMAERKRSGRLQDRGISRKAAERWFHPGSVLDELESVLHVAVKGA